MTYMINMVYLFFLGFLLKIRNELMKSAATPQLKSNGPLLQRSLFTLGLLCKHFDFENELKTQNNVSSYSHHSI